MNRMRAAVFQGPGKMSLQTVALPALDAGSLLIRVESVGLCGSDVRIFHQGSPRVRPPAVIGHEISGTIAAVGKKVKGWRVGERVAVGSGIPCGRCSYCKAGLGNVCEKDLMFGFQIPGGLAEYMRIPAFAVAGGPLSKISGLSFDEATMAEPLGALLHAFEKIQFKPGQSLGIIGSGPVGLMAAILARAKKASHVILLGKNEKSLRLARSLGIGNTFLFEPGRSPFKTRAKGLSAGNRDAVLVACGSLEAQEVALEWVRKGGAVNFFGVLPRSAGSLPLRSNDIHYREVMVTGTHGSLPIHHKEAVSLLKRHSSKFKKLISHVFPISRMGAALKVMETEYHMKIVIHPRS